MREILGRRRRQWRHERPRPPPDGVAGQGGPALLRRRLQGVCRGRRAAGGQQLSGLHVTTFSLAGRAEKVTLSRYLFDISLNSLGVWIVIAVWKVQLEPITTRKPIYSI